MTLLYLEIAHIPLYIILGNVLMHLLFINMLILIRYYNVPDTYYKYYIDLVPII